MLVNPQFCALQSGICVLHEIKQLTIQILSLPLALHNILLQYLCNLLGMVNCSYQFGGIGRQVGVFFKANAGFGSCCVEERCVA
jgi:hypothetical protein